VDADSKEAANKLRKFKADLKTRDVPLIVQKHITFGHCHVLDEDQHFRLKSAVAAHFDLHPSEVLIVGSGKLGFSIAPTKRYRLFGESSDVDVAVTSPVLFDRIWEEVFEYDQSGGFWPKKEKFIAYLFRGWIRPDQLPDSELFAVGSDWWEFFRGLTEGGDYGPYKVRGALYKSWYFLERYQQIAVGECKKELAGS
jgi:hypothetical protein